VANGHAHTNGNANENTNVSISPNLSDEAKKLTDEIAESLRMAHTNMNTVQTLSAKLGTKNDTHELREKLKGKLGKTNEYLKEIPSRMKKLESIAKKDDSYSIQLQKLKNDVKECMNRVRIQTEEAAKQEKMNIIKVKQETQTLKEEARDTVIDVEQSERDSLLREKQRQEFASLQQMRDEIEHNETIIRERESDFQNIESQINDINSIFRELHYMVNEQGEHLDLIETQIEDAALKVHEGTENLVISNDLDKKGRNVMCIILIVVLGIAAAITVLLVVLKGVGIF